MNHDDIVRAAMTRNAWRWACGRPEVDIAPEYPPLPALQRTEWSPAFESLMRNRLVVGGLRYGLLHASGKPRYDLLGAAEERLAAYRATRNQEHLVDVANLCLLVFEEDDHPRRHFHASDDGAHVRKVSRS